MLKVTLSDIQQILKEPLDFRSYSGMIMAKIMKAQRKSGLLSK